MDIEITEGTPISKLQSASPLSKLITKIRPFRVRFLLIEFWLMKSHQEETKTKIVSAFVFSELRGYRGCAHPEYP